MAIFSLNSRVVRCQGTEKSLKASPKTMSYCFLPWFFSTNWRASPQVVLIGVSRGRPSRREVGAGDGGVDLGDVDRGLRILVLHVALEGVRTAAQEEGLERGLRGVRLAGGLAFVAAAPVGHQAVDVLVVVIEPFGVAEDEVAVDQVVEHEGRLCPSASGSLVTLM